MKLDADLHLTYFPDLAPATFTAYKRMLAWMKFCDYEKEIVESEGLGLG